MNKHIVLTFIASDKPGLVEKIASVVSANHASWLDSRLANLAGRFAGIIRIDASKADVDALSAQLLALESHGFKLTIENVDDQDNQVQALQRRITILGNDRPGIVNEVAQALATHHINVDELNSHVGSAPMSGEALFEAEVLISVPETVSLDDLIDELDAIANELTVDISLGTT